MSLNLSQHHNLDTGFEHQRLSVIQNVGRHPRMRVSRLGTLSLDSQQPLLLSNYYGL